MAIEYAVYRSELLGDLYIASDGEAIMKVELFPEEWCAFAGGHPVVQSRSPLLERALRQLDEYFHGRRRTFDLPLKWKGTPFQEEVWAALCRIPYGETATYADIAAQIGRPKAVRAVGQANRANELAIIVPCHRIVGKNGALVGYAGSRTDVKAKLLELERRYQSRFS
ncbi:Methylated-DNA--protein-cysteine methyltransferase, constitutive [Geobacillus stearothermophilus]|uniref:methylated-DNA--[protein]-cysteine S-methyltransferase n=1 Tax=Geobacillus sp. DSP4a TaxID=2508873 RepID=UPI00067E21AA|nr:methylated-DNA--[protein]-cysteine S-methyltransferase [Geobacillus sp. DSP4a]AKU27480.1 cysteine methyltransferase [Geobacillus sp. LC300]KZE96539.1 Methylated-DNA--protein-cysteine methyltransferase, constitutive [Geobacillus stearothermophilus]KZM55364.1 cysteine methyltransferase [Geobacillus stearothermophilus]NNU99638.1 methylated-DNA--[protein]-cysteine S-methyltransferase [Geobacillus sp. DSP4a]QOR85097.1 methylated-DNA--[protein]-cysteine S-methyltransferase [Geobacillus stearother